MLKVRVNQTNFHTHTIDNIKLSARIYKTEFSTNKLIVLFHGVASHKNNSTNRALITPLLNNGFNVLCFDFRGCGYSEGDIRHTSTSSGVKDFEAVYFELINNYPEFKNNDLYFIGLSFGGGVALACSKKYNVQSVVLQAPVVDMLKTQKFRRTKQQMINWKKDGFIQLSNEIGTFVLNYTYLSDSIPINLFNPKYISPSLRISIIHGTADAVVSIKTSDEFVRHYKKQIQAYLRVENGDHNLDSLDFQDQKIDFIINQLPRS